MNYMKVFLIVVISINLTLQLCDASAIKTKFYRKKSNYPKYQADYSECHNCRKTNAKEMYAYHHIRQPRGVDNENSTVLEENQDDASTITTTTTIPQEDIKILDQKYSQNASGEYKHEVLFSNNAWRAEQGEYEDHNGSTIFVIRGVFQYRTREGKLNTTLYIVDEYGYHNVQPPPQLTQEGSGIVDYRPDIDSTADDCGNDKGTYCIDPKLLALLVG